MLQIILFFIAASTHSLNADKINMTATWMTGSNNLTVPQLAVYDTIFVPFSYAQPGGRFGACYASSLDGASFYIYGGEGFALWVDQFLSDFWRFDLSTGWWTVLQVSGSQASNAPMHVPDPRANPGGQGYNGGGISGFDGQFYVMSSWSAGTLWAYNFTSNLWTWSAGNSTYNNGYSVGLGIEHPMNIPNSRYLAVYAAHPRKDAFYVFGGYAGSNNGSAFLGFSTTFLNDLWRFNISTQMWTWISGNYLVRDNVGVYGVQGVPSNVTVPGSRHRLTGFIDSLTENFFIFGGTGVPNNNNICSLNDLWSYNFNIRQWTWLSGSNSCIHGSSLGTGPGFYSTTNMPSARTDFMIGTFGNSSIIYVFAGASTTGLANDLWLYNITSNQWAYIRGGPTSSDSSGSFGVQGQTSSTSFPAPRKLAVVVYTSKSPNSLWLMGGQTPPQAIGDMWRFDFQFTANVTQRANLTSSYLGTSSTSTSTADGKPSLKPKVDEKTVTASDANVFSLLLNSVIIQVVVGVAVVVFITLVVFLIRHRRQRKRLNEFEISYSTMSSMTSYSSSLNATTMTVKTVVVDETEFSMPGFLQVKIGLQFRIEKRIAKGGGGEVFIGTSFDTKMAALGTQIIVKKVAEQRADMSLKMSAGFDQEVSLMHYLGRHRNIADLLGWCEEPMAILMKLYSLGSLEAVFKAGLVSVKSVKVAFALDISNGLMFMHGKCVAHCDIKPANVLVDRDQYGFMYCVLTDFGISQIFSQNSQLVGAFRVTNLRGLSLTYASPEVIQRFRKQETNLNFFDASKADMYSLSILIQDILTDGKGGWSSQYSQYSVKK